MKILSRRLVLLLAVYMISGQTLFAVERTFRIMVIGTSQTWGSGARYKDETFVSVLEEYLNDKMDGRTYYRCINCGVQGSNSTKLLQYYSENWIKSDPDMVIINLSNNDRGDTDTFYSNLKKFSDMNRTNKTRMLFVLEANSYEESFEELEAHKSMIKAGMEEGIKVLGLHEYIRSRKDAGIIWWDGVHFTSFGHRLTADFLLPHVIEKIKEDIESF